MSAPPAPSTAERIRAALAERLAPIRLAVEDESAQHAGHAGAREGGHFRVQIVSERFRGLTRIGRHRLVYECIAERLTLKAAGIHALAIEARTPEEVKS
ncbi:MAG: BolA family protein [Steroidobacteraceae bacterium]